MKRAAALLVAIEAAEREIMKDRQKRDLTPNEVKAILDEMVRAELAAIIGGLDVEARREAQNLRRARGAGRDP